MKNFWKYTSSKIRNLKNLTNSGQSDALNLTEYYSQNSASVYRKFFLLKRTFLNLKFLVLFVTIFNIYTKHTNKDDTLYDTINSRGYVAPQVGWSVGSDLD